MDFSKIIQTLHPLERKILPSLKANTNFSDIVSVSKLKEVEAMRALQWLSNKKVLEIEETVSETVSLDTNGKKYVEDGLPEKKFLNLIKGGSKTVNDLKKVMKDEFNICIGTLKSKAAIEFTKGTITITDNGKKMLQKESLEERFLKKSFPILLVTIKDEEKFAFDNLKKRKDILKVDLIKTKTIKLTKIGEQLVKQDFSVQYEDKLTPEKIKGSEEIKLRKYDVNIQVPKLSGGKKHFVNQAIDYIRQIWLELGFTEMTGSMVQTAFWDLDALFVPQDHPARQMQDTFYLKDPAKGIIPQNYKDIKKVHENGWDTGSTGWKSKWSTDIAKENLLRTHTTVLSAQTISKLKETDIPAKFFSVGKVFRNEALDYKHLFEFYQVEGIVVDKNNNVMHLKGYLREFFTKMGYEDVRIRPGYFPYVEPGFEVDGFHPTMKKWVELGGAGIFRPEVTKPLMGKETPVLAWGLGMARIISEYWGLKDIRDLYRNDLKQLKEMKFFLK